MITLLLRAHMTLLQSGTDGLSEREAEVAMTAIFMGAVLITIVGSVLVWQLVGAWRTRMAVGREHAYQELVDEMAKSQRRTDTNLQRVLDEMVDLRNRTAEIERMLKEVG
jgi:Tfp pilus assembly protein PilN